MPLVEGQLAVVKKYALYKDLDSGDKDYLDARDVVRVIYKRGMSWVVDAGPGKNTMLVPASALTGFQDPIAAEKKYKPGSIWGPRRIGNPGYKRHMEEMSRYRRLSSDSRTRGDMRGYYSGSGAAYSQLLSAQEARTAGMPNPWSIGVTQARSVTKKQLIDTILFRHYPGRQQGVALDEKNKLKRFLTGQRKVTLWYMYKRYKNPLIESLISGVGVGAGFALGSYGAQKVIRRVK